MITCLSITVPMLGYLGPGGVLTLLGSGLALLAAIAVAFFGLIWYPLKRLLRWWRETKAQQVPCEPDPKPSVRRSRR